jgi:hypothetical protein
MLFYPLRKDFQNDKKNSENVGMYRKVKEFQNCKNYENVGMYRTPLNRFRKG